MMPLLGRILSLLSLAQEHHRCWLRMPKAQTFVSMDKSQNFTSLTPQSRQADTIISYSAAPFPGPYPFGQAFLCN